MRLIDVIPVRDVLGEGLFWSMESGAFWWTDIEGCRVHSYDMATQMLETFDTPMRLSAFGERKTGGSFIAAFEVGFASYNPRSGALDWINQPQLHTGARFNDGRIDRQGRFWCGTMSETGEVDTGELYCLDSSCSIRTTLGEIGISNGLAWSPDSQTMYFADSAKRQIRVFDFDASHGTHSNERVFATTEPGVAPDGATVDSAGNYWSATWGAGEVRAYAPNGTVIERVPIPASNVTCVAFGGPDLNILAVTTATKELSDADAAQQEQAGHVFLFETRYKGKPEPKFG